MTCALMDAFQIQFFNLSLKEGQSTKSQVFPLWTRHVENKKDVYLVPAEGLKILASLLVQSPAQWGFTDQPQDTNAQFVELLAGYVVLFILWQFLWV
jgi:hypothetical protein